MKAEKISREMANKLIEAWCNGIGIPYETWYTVENGVYIAIDNRDGCCWVDEYETEEAALRSLED